jgi:hypothetical protein
MNKQAYSFTRPAQLGENARIPELGHIPYCAGAQTGHGSLDNCDAALTQLRFYGFEMGDNCSHIKTDAFETWGPFTSAEEFGLDTKGQKFEIPRRFGNVLYDIDGRDTIPIDVNEEDNDNINRDPDGNLIGEDMSFVRSEVCFFKQPYTALNIDTDLARQVNEEYRLNPGDTLLNESKPYMCHYNRILMCSAMAKERTNVAKVRELQNFACRDQKSGVKKVTRKYFVKGVKGPLSDFHEIFDGKSFDHKYLGRSQGVAYEYTASTKGIPMFCSKNMDAHMTGELSRISPVLYMMFVLDNYGPFGIHTGNTGCTSTKPAKPSDVADAFGGPNVTANIKHFDHHNDGSGDVFDRLIRTLPDDVCPTHYNNRTRGGAAGHTTAVVAYKFIPNRPDAVIFVLFNSHDFSGHPASLRRGTIVRRIPFSSTFYGFNGVLPIAARWNQLGMPMKYYFDGSEEVPEGAKGGTNEVRGGSAYDWTQTSDYDKSGKSLENKGDGTEGKHCGLGTFCEVAANSGKTPFINRPVYQSKFTKKTKRRVLISYPNDVTCDQIPVTMSEADARAALKNSDGISFYTTKLETTDVVDVFLNVTSRVVELQEGRSVFALDVSENDNEIFHDRNYKYHLSIGRTLPLCTPAFKTITDLTPNYTSIGSATVCTGGKTVAGVVNERACSMACDKDKDCAYFSFHYKTTKAKIPARTLGFQNSVVARGGIDQDRGC